MNEVRQGQSFLDMALQMTGSIDNAVALAVLNGRSLTDDLSVGQVLKEMPGGKQKVIDFFTPASSRPATDLTYSPVTLPEPQEGISFWVIRVDFTVTELEP